MKCKGMMKEAGLSVNRFQRHQHSRTESSSPSSKTDEDEHRNPGATEAVWPMQRGLGLRTGGSGRGPAAVLGSPELRVVRKGFL